jgi:hypothetical protein
VCDLEASGIRRLWLALGCNARGEWEGKKYTGEARWLEITGVTIKAFSLTKIIVHL